MKAMRKRKRIKELEKTILEHEAHMKWQADRIAMQQKWIAQRDEMLEKVREAVGFSRQPVVYGGGGGGGYVEIVKPT